MPLQKVGSDLPYPANDFFNRRRTIGAILLVHFVKLCLQFRQSLVALPSYQVSNNIAGGSESALFFAGLYPGGLVLR